jgi:hypothetical protein
VTSMTNSAVRLFKVHVHPLRWLGQRDRDFAALRRAARAAITGPRCPRRLPALPVPFMAVGQGDGAAGRSW